MTTIYLKTFGCSHNFADSEELAFYLSSAGFEVIGLTNLVNISEIDLIEKSDLIIYNTCTVKNPTDDKFFSLLERTKKPAVLAGCIPQSQRDELWLKKFSAVGVDCLDSIVEVVKKTLQGIIIHRLDKKKSLNNRVFPVVRRNSFVAIIPILQGCLGNCTYCKTKHARGHLKSYPLKTIIGQVRKAKLDGVKEIWLVSEDNGAYGKDIGSSFPELLREIANFLLLKVNSNIDKFQVPILVRIGMLNPEYAFEYMVELAELIKLDCFYKFLHIPIQAASNAVLSDMKRAYTIEQCETTFNYFKKQIPNITLATDIICGFPTEYPEQFENTLSFVKKQKFVVVNISKFYPRPNTVAANMKLLPTTEVKRRSKKLSDWFSSVNFNKEYIGQTVSALFIERGKFDGSFIGKTNNYRNVIVKSDKNILGKQLNVKIKTTTRDDLRGTLI